jgi:CheY-like chemotaxis protein
MPRLDGGEFLEALRRLEPRIDSFVVLVSGFVDLSNAEPFLAMGADVVLAKPIRIERIQELLVEVERRKGERVDPSR